MENTNKKGILQIIGIICLGIFISTLFFSENIAYIRFAILIETICFVSFLFKLKIEYEEHRPNKLTWYMALISIALFIITLLKMC